MTAAEATPYGRARTGSTVVWLTPPAMLQALGPFDLDPCAATGRPWPTAEVHFTEADDGLSQPWHGFVWCNPPYGAGIDAWMQRCAEHGNGLALIPARTETRWFHRWVWPFCEGVLFMAGRPRFHRLDGQAAASTIPLPVCLVAYGHVAIRRLLQADLAGCLVSRACLLGNFTNEHERR